MNIQGYQYQEEIQSQNPYRCFRALNQHDDSPAIIKISSENQSAFRELELFKKDHVISLSLSKNCSHVLKPIELNQSNNLNYLTYENFNGVTLEEILHQHPLELKNVLQIAIGVSDALVEIHKQNIIHKNLNISNILVNPETYEIKLLDFRNASDNSLKHESYNLTSGNINLKYISPELTGRLQYGVDHRSDYYSFGMILYEMIAGTTPFESSDPMEMIHSHIARVPKPINIHSGTCPQVVSDLILKLISKMPADRYQSSIGIHHDLTLCLKQLEEKKELVSFNLAEYDFSSHFTLPSIFYGRRDALDLLDVKLKNINEQNFISIVGETGVGKTALVEEWERRNHSELIFVQGKYGQYENNYPYSAFIQIIEGLTKYLLSENESEFNKYYSQLEERLGTNSGIITQLVPSFESIMGKQPRPLTLGPAESRNRFIEAISSLLSVFSDERKPLVIFIDDLQWADDASLQLLESFLEADWVKNTLFIGGTRDEKIKDNNTLKGLFNNFKTKKSFSEVRLSNFDKELVKNYISKTLQADTESINTLAIYVFNVTQGNVFYLRQLLHNMHQDGLIWANEESQKWSWDISNKQSHIENIDLNKLLGSMINKLNINQLLLLKYGVCMGGDFSISDLAYVLDISEDELILQVTPMLNQALLNINANNISFRHDGVQQAVAKSSGESEFQKIHFNIGQQYLKREQSDLSGERLLSITNHLNKSEPLLESIEDIDKLLELNYLSAQSTLENCAYLLSLEYSTAAVRLIDKVSSHTRDKYYFNVKINHARCLYLNTRHKEARGEINLVFNASESLSQKSKCYSIFKDILVSEESDFNEAVKIGLKILESASLSATENAAELTELNKEKRIRINALMLGKEPKDLLNYPLLEDEDKKYLLAVLIDLWEAAYYDANEGLMQYSILCAVVISLEHGHTSESSFAYVIYGMTLTLEENYIDSYNFGSMALKLNEKFSDKVMLPKVTNLFCNYINFHIRPYESSTALYTKSSEIGQQNGDYLFGLWATIFIIWSRFLANDNLNDVLITSGKLKGFITQTNDRKMIYVQNLLESVVGSLKGVDVNGNSVVIDRHDEFLEYWKENNFLPGITWHAILLGQYYCISGEFDKAYELLSQKDMVSSPGLIMFPHAQIVFYRTLSLLKLSNKSEILLTEEQVESIEENIALMDKWAGYCPENFLSQLNLLQAEKKSYDSLLWEASVLYGKAIESGIKYNSLCNVALSNELASEFWTKNDNAQLAKHHLKDAIFYYNLWGAKQKSVKLSEQGGEVDDFISTTIGSQTNSINSDVFNNPSELDLYTVLKFTQAISNEVDEGKLIEKSMRIILENAGADKGAFISVKNNQLLVDVIADYENEKLNINNDVASMDNIQQLPNGTINYVHRSKNFIALDSPDFSKHHQDMEYIKENNVKCIGCLPIMHNGILIAILYLENKSTTGIFDEARIHVLQMLVSQLSISLQNAFLYQSLSEEVGMHKKTTEALVSSEERLRLSHHYSNVGVWDWNILTNDLYWNEMISPMFGGPEVEMETSYDNFINSIHPEDQQHVNDAIQECFDGKKYRIEHRVVWQDGTIRWVLESGDVMRDEEGNPTRMLGIVRDITDKKNEDSERLTLEKQLQQAQKMEAIGQLTGGIAHDFNNILAANLGYAELIEQKLETLNKSDINKYINEVIKSGKRATKLVAQMLAYSRTNEIETETLDIMSVVDETVSMLSSVMPSSIKISFNRFEDILKIKANSVQINQIIMNVCINARDALNEHGNININVYKNQKITGLCSSCFSPINGDFVELSISDNGGGVSKDIIDTIFNPFVTTKDVGKGSGMGLSMVHGIVHNHKGHVVFDSVEGVGSNFRIFFPVTEIEHEKYISPLDSKLDITKNYSVLVVDDEVAIVELIKEVLSNKGCKVTTCTNSNDALKLLNDNIDDFDIMITDQTMPDVTGAELSTAALKIKPSFPIIVCTGYSSVLSEQVAIKLGIKRLLPKPLVMSELQGVIEDLLG